MTHNQEKCVEKLFNDISNARVCIMNSDFTLSTVSTKDVLSSAFIYTLATHLVVEKGYEQVRNGEQNET